MKQVIIILFLSLVATIHGQGSGQAECNNTDVRIVGYSADEGRVEYCEAGRWGTVCDDMWDENDVTVVCRQLGFTSPKSPGVLQSAHVPSDGAMDRPIVLSGLSCTGNEANISECSSSLPSSGCTHQRDAGVRCACRENDFRLYGANLTNINRGEGRAEICQNGVWHLFCSEGFNVVDAVVACKQLGFDPIDGFVPRLIQNGNFDFLFAHSIFSFPIYQSALTCNGSETTLSSCPRTALNPPCSFPNGVGLICPVSGMLVECENNDIRLQNGLISTQVGRVEVCSNRKWHLVCDNMWDDRDAAVVCNQLGFGGGIAIREAPSSPSPFGPGPNSALDFILDELMCNGEEPDLFRCEHPAELHDCFPNRNAAGLVCGTSMERCSAGEIMNSTVRPMQNKVVVPTFGSCERFDMQFELCSEFFHSTSYVFNSSRLDTNLDTNLNSIRDKLDVLQRFGTVLDTEGSICNRNARSLLCNYFFPPCGNQSGVHLPLAVCHEECVNISQLCPKTWSEVVQFLNDEEGLEVINCDNTSQRSSGISDCCSGFGIQFTLTGTAGTTPLVVPTPSHVLPLIGGVIAAVVLIALVLVAVIVCFCISNAKRKSVVRRMQMDVLASPSARSVTERDGNQSIIEKPSPFVHSNTTPIDFRSRGSLDFRKPSVHGSATPNNYITVLSSEKEIDFTAPLLNVGSDKSANRISATIMRELSTDMVIPYCRLKLLNCIGQGEFGVVYKADYTYLSEESTYEISTVAVKTLKGFFDNDKVDKIMDESLKMKRFDHPNVLSLIGVCLDAGPAPYVVMPFMANGSLLQYLKKERPNIFFMDECDEDVKIDVRKRLTLICLQIANGMEYLAEEKFIHRDLAARNCMIDLHFVIKIADFGLSEDVYLKNYFRQNDDNQSIKLPIKWMAPESLNDGVFSEKTDVWSFGVTCWEVFSGGKTPYPGVDPILLSQMLESGRRLDKPHNAACSNEIYTLMKNCWLTKANSRPYFKDIVKTLSTYVESLAGYLDMSFNPLAPNNDLKSSDAEYSILTRPDQLAALYDHQKSKNKNKSPRSSPRASPRASPLPSPSNSRNGLLSSANNPGIVISIDPSSPS